MMRIVRKYGLFLLAVAIGLIGSLWLSMQMSIPQLLNQEIGTSGGIVLEFSGEMRIDSVAARLTISPNPGFRLEWDNSNLTIWPVSSWEPGTAITLHLKAGAEDLLGRKILRDFQGRVSVRTPGLVYLSPISNIAEIWRIIEFGGTPEKITADQTGVIELAVSTDGEWIAYSVENQLGGADIWLMDRDGGEKKLLVECGKAVCNEIAWQPTRQRIAYSHYEKGYQGVPSVWAADVQTGEISQFFGGQQITSQFPSFSPASSYISVFSPSLGGIYLQNLEDGSSTVFQTSIPQKAIWSPDGKVILFQRSIELEGQPVDKIYRFDLLSKSITLAIGSEDDLFNYGTPAWNPNGDTIAIPVRQIEGGLSSQVWLFDSGGQLIQKISDDQVYTHGGLRWRMDGKLLVIIRLSVDSSIQQPEIILWDMQTDIFIPIAEDASGPVWLP
jgi:Tol biopolymer transport system component